jgi:hypothetical protein
VTFLVVDVGSLGEVSTNLCCCIDNTLLGTCVNIPSDHNSTNGTTHGIDLDAVLDRLCWHVLHILNGTSHVSDHALVRLVDQQSMHGLFLST